MTVSMPADAYMAMVRAARNQDARPDLPGLRIAVLADHATQQFVLVLRAAMVEQGFSPAVYEAEYATSAFEAHDPKSGLYDFKPDIALVSHAVQKYRARWLDTAEPEARETLPETYLAEVLGIVDALMRARIGVIASNLALPLERMFGNYAALTRQSLYGSVLAFNALLSQALLSRPGCQINDVMYLANRVGAENFFDERLWVAAKYLCANRCLPDLARSVARAAAARSGRITKCIVLDLDNTLWGGIIGDDGMAGIGLGGDAMGEAFQLFQRYLLGLKQRGYVLAVCSKNNEENALEVFRSHPEMVLREEDIAIFVINWNDKASNIEYISRVLNLGLDSFVFLDDSPFERELVRTALPTVAVPELPDDIADYVATLERTGLFEAIGYSEADAQRVQMYREESLRTTEELKFGNIDDYLISLNMSIECGPFTPERLPRVAQLIQRSNQFNLCTRRFSEADCARFMNDDDHHVTLQARLRDKFGDYGLICAICGDIDAGELVIRELVMSCRVLKRGVEAFLMNHLFEICRDRNLRGIRGEYRRSLKNQMVRDFYRDFGFNPVDIASDDVSVWLLETEQYQRRPTFIGQILQ